MSPASLTWITYALLGLLLATGIVAAFSRNLFGTAMMLGCYSFLLAILWSLWGGLDVGFTEAVVSSGAGTLFFVALLWNTTHHVKGVPLQATDSVFLILALALVAGGMWVILGMSPWQDPQAMVHQYVSPDYIEQSMRYTHTPNIVTAVLADFRGFDTLMETVVIFAAGVACWLLGTDR